MGKDDPQFTATMQPEDAARYWREQCEIRDMQLSVANEVAEKLSRELREALAAVKTLARLMWNSSL